MRDPNMKFDQRIIDYAFVIQTPSTFERSWNAVEGAMVE